VRAGILIRLSYEKDTQIKTDKAFERFEASCRKLCEARGWPVVEVFHEGIVSAYQGKTRKVLDAALRALEHDTIDVLVVPTVDRLVRRMWDAARIAEVLKKSGKSIFTADGNEVPDDPDAEFDFNQRANLAHRESAITAKRVRDQIAQRKAEGKPHRGGLRPYGFTKLGGEAIEDEAKILREAADKLLLGYTTYAVTEWVNATGDLNWQTPTLRHTLYSPAMAGLLEIEKGQFLTMKTDEGTDAPQILDRATWERLRLLFDNRERQKGGRGPSHLLTGILLCGNCLAPLQSHRRAKSQGADRVYFCKKAPGKRGCGRLSIAASPVEHFIVDRALKRWNNLLEQSTGAVNPTNPDGQALAVKIRELEGMLSDLGREYGRRKVSLPAFLAADASIREQLKSAYSGFEYAVAEKILINLDPVTSYDEALATFTAMDLTERRAMIRFFFGEIVIKPIERRGGRKADMSRVLFADAAKSYLATSK
jgi:site-specific DNA recombinase